VAANSFGEPIKVTAATWLTKAESGLTLPRIVDGTTNVLMFATKYSDCNKSVTRYYAGPLGPPFPTFPPANPNYGVSGGFFGAGAYNSPAARGPLTATTLMFQIAPRNDNDPIAGCMPQPVIYGHSFGTSGLSTALCDGSVKIISPTMSPATFGKALSPGDQQPLGPDWTQN
jgi:hypothetical protein